MPTDLSQQAPVMVTQLGLLVEELDELIGLVPVNFEKLLEEDDIQTIRELKNFQEREGHFLTMAVSSTLQSINSLAMAIFKEAKDNGENVPEIVDLILSKADRMKYLMAPPPEDHRSAIIRNLVSRGLELLEDSDEIGPLASHLASAKDSVEMSWFRPDEWAANRDHWPRFLNQLSLRGYTYGFDESLLGRLDETKRCFIAGFYDASIAMARSSFEAMVKFGANRLDVSLTDDRDPARMLSLNKINKRIENEFGFKWNSLGKRIVDPADAILHDPQLNYIDCRSEARQVASYLADAIFRISADVGIDLKELRS